MQLLYLNDVLKRDIHLEVVFAVRLQPTVGETVVVGGREEIQGILWGHGDVPVVGVAQ